MKQFLIEEESEKKNILSMHKSLMKEQTRATGELDENERILRKAISAGCLKNGSLKRQKSTGKLYYKKESTKQIGKFVRFFPDMTFAFEDGSRKGKWVCPQLANATATEITTQQTTADNESKIATEIKKGWKKLETLRAEGVDLTTLDKVYDTQVVGNVTLYRPKGSSTNFTPNTSTADFNKDQLSFISTFEQKGYKLNPSRIEQSTLVKVTDKDLGAPADLFPNGLVMWYNPNTQDDIKRNDGSVLSDVLSNQSIDRQACRKNVTDYFETFRRKNSIVIDPATINKAKRIVQACKDEHYGKWGIAGGGNRLDNYLDILSGNKEGGPTSYGDDSIWRIK
jgi:hypothetical protein